MRTLFLILLLANLAFVGFALDVLGLDRRDGPRAIGAQFNPERLRLVRDTSSRPAPAPQAPRS